MKALDEVVERTNCHRSKAEVFEFGRVVLVTRELAWPAVDSRGQ